MPTPKPPYPAAFRQQMIELVRAGSCWSRHQRSGPRVRLQCQQHPRLDEGVPAVK